MYIPSFRKKIISSGALLNGNKVLQTTKDECNLVNLDNGAKISFQKDESNGMFYLFTEVEQNNNTEQCNTIQIQIEWHKNKYMYNVDFT